MEVIATKIPDVLLLKPTVFEDGRGFFMEIFNAENFAAHGLPTEFVQDNHSGSSQNVLRGLHYQIKEPQGKLVRVTAGVVFDVASTNFGGGVSYERYLNSANVVRILHDDGSYAVYAHLNWNSVRVKPGDKVERGQYIADSGNTGVSSGPHLHFAVIRNKGLELESVPIAFEGRDGSAVTPLSGMELVAY